jgi:excisionase family DNA binding protein
MVNVVVVIAISFLLLMTFHLDAAKRADNRRALLKTISQRTARQSLRYLRPLPLVAASPQEERKEMHQADTSAHPSLSQRIAPNPPPARSSCRFAQLAEGSAPSMQAPPASGSIAGDILYGADAIAAFLFGTKGGRRTVYNLVQNKQLPHFRVGANICARKSVLLAWIEAQEAAAGNPSA